MRAKKWSVVVSFAVAIISLGFFIQYRNMESKIIADISLALFGSAVVSFTLSLVEYFSERRVAMECFWTEAIDSEEGKQAAPKETFVFTRAYTK